MLNKGEGFTDEFEMEVHIYSEKSSSRMKQQYKEWTSTMRKEGTAFFKSVKDRVCSPFYYLIYIIDTFFHIDKKYFMNYDFDFASCVS